MMCHSIGLYPACVTIGAPAACGRRKVLEQLGEQFSSSRAARAGSHQTGTLEVGNELLRRSSWVVSRRSSRNRSHRLVSLPV